MYPWGGGFLSIDDPYPCGFAREFFRGYLEIQARIHSPVLGCPLFPIRIPLPRRVQAANGDQVGPTRREILLSWFVERIKVLHSDGEEPLFPAPKAIQNPEAIG